MPMIKFSPGNCCCQDPFTCDTECCESGSVTNTVELDFGGSILTDNECNTCDEIGGVFELEGNGDCSWYAEFDYECGGEFTIDCGSDPSRNYNGYRLIFLMTMNATFCNIGISVSVVPLMDGIEVALSDSCEFGGGAAYFRNGGAGTIKIPCDEPFSVDLTSSGGWGNFCSDSFPATVLVTFV